MATSNVHYLPQPYEPRDTSNMRPFHLYDAKTKHDVPHRYFASDRNAHDAALLFARWDLKVGNSLEVIDVRYGKHLGTYTRAIAGIMFTRARQLDYLTEDEKKNWRKKVG